MHAVEEAEVAEYIAAIDPVAVIMRTGQREVGYCEWLCDQAICLMRHMCFGEEKMDALDLQKPSKIRKLASTGNGQGVNALVVAVSYLL